MAQSDDSIGFGCLVLLVVVGAGFLLLFPITVGPIHFGTLYGMELTLIMLVGPGGRLMSCAAGRRPRRRLVRALRSMETGPCPTTAARPGWGMLVLVRSQNSSECFG